MADINSPVHHLLDCISLKPSQAGNHKCDPGLKFVQFSVMTDLLDLLWNRNVKHFSIYTTFKVCSGGTSCIFIVDGQNILGTFSGELDRQMGRACGFSCDYNWRICEYFSDPQVGVCALPLQDMTLLLAVKAMMINNVMSH